MSRTTVERAAHPTYLCVATRFEARGLGVLPVFIASSARVARVARRTPGNVRSRRLGMPPLRTFFTLSVWESREAMRTFVEAPVHAEAMAHMDDWARAGQFVEFSSPSKRVGWRRAMRELRSDRATVHQPN